MPDVLTWVLEFLKPMWGVLTEMSPYLLFGFFMAGLLSVLISPETVERHLGAGGFLPILKAAMFGVPLPLCSCGVIPVGASLKRHGAGSGPTVAFLISTPQTGVDSIMATLSLLGPVYAVFRPLFALVSGLVGGSLVALFSHDAKPGVAEGLKCQAECCAGGNGHGRLYNIFHYGFVTLPRDIARALIIGVLIAALLTVLLPPNFFARHVQNPFLVMLLMMALGIPIYVCATASIPIALALIAHAGVSPGAALVFLMTGPATNAASIATIWKVMGRRTAVLYLLSVAVMALAGGLLLDHIWHFIGAPLPVMPSHLHDGTTWWGILKAVSAVTLLLILAYAVFRPSLGHLAGRDESAEGMQETALSVEGMTCSHCVEAVRRALREQQGVHSAVVDLKTGRAVVRGMDFSPAALTGAVEELGYKASVAGAFSPGNRKEESQ